MSEYTYFGNYYCTLSSYLCFPININGFAESWWDSRLGDVYGKITS